MLFQAYLLVMIYHVQTLFLHIHVISYHDKFIEMKYISLFKFSPHCNVTKALFIICITGRKYLITLRVPVMSFTAEYTNSVYLIVREYVEQYTRSRIHGYTDPLHSCRYILGYLITQHAEFQGVLLQRQVILI